MPRIRAVLFDFDGTLADSYAAITASVNHVLQHYGRPTLTEAKVRTLVGHGLEQLMDTILPGVDHDEAAKLYRAHHPTVMKSLTRLLPGVLDGLKQLHAAGLKMGVCSNKPSKFTRELVAAFELDRFLSVVVGPDDVGTIKPDPTMLFTALEKLGASKDVALYVGDMEVDIETGRRAGIETWVMPTGSNDEATLRAAGYARIFTGMPNVITSIMDEKN
ncbi:MAG TPA: HAD-IA family hydrolase [Gemmataceae bacterium]|jgi:phosphoglycolate phosphatase|nr:HAD-IA family hydrolase [Gemmataceae bacterium]